MFSIHLKNFLLFSSNLRLPSADCFNLDQSKNFRLVMGKTIQSARSRVSALAPEGFNDGHNQSIEGTVLNSCLFKQGVNQLNGVLRCFQHYVSHIMETDHIFLNFLGSTSARMGLRNDLHNGTSCPRDRSGELVVTASAS